MGGYPTAQNVRYDASVSRQTDALDPDTDGDGYWDGWIGVYGVGESANVVLYIEHLRDDDDGDGLTVADGDDDGGIAGEEIVEEQVGVHNVRHENWAPYQEDLVPAAWAVDFDDDGWLEHSNVHLGERHWGTSPTAKNDVPDTTLEIEVDYIEGRNPLDMRNANGRSVLEGAERNFELYGLNIEYEVDDELTIDQLNSTCKYTLQSVCVANVTPNDLNRWELDVIEDKYHDDGAKMHVLWATEMANDYPKTPVDEKMNYSNVTPGGLSFTNGAPNTELYENAFWDFGYTVLEDEYVSPTYADIQSVTMHEMGHMLGAGWADDDPIAITIPGHDVIVAPRGYEAYSGDVDGEKLFPDETPENTTRGDREWSIMMAGTADNYGTPDKPRFLFSIEEIHTIDFKYIPSKKGEDE